MSASHGAAQRPCSDHDVPAPVADRGAMRQKRVSRKTVEKLTFGEEPATWAAFFSGTTRRMRSATPADATATMANRPRQPTRASSGSSPSGSTSPTCRSPTRPPTTSLTSACSPEASRSAQAGPHRPDVEQGVRIAVDLRSRVRLEDALCEPRPGRGPGRPEPLCPDLEPAAGLSDTRLRLRAGDGAEALAASRRHPPPACTPPMRSPDRRRWAR